MKNFPTIDISKSWFQVETNDEKEYFIKYEKGKLKTPKGKIIKSNNYRLLEQICGELNALDILDPGDFNTYSLYSIQFDILNEMLNRIIEELEHFIFSDPTLMACAGPEKAYQLPKWKSLFNYLDDIEVYYPDFPQVNETGIREWLEPDGESSNNVKKLIQTLKTEIESLSNAQKAGFIAITSNTNAIIYSLLVSTDKCIPSEFANAIFAGMHIHPKLYLDGNLKENKNRIDELTKMAYQVQNFIALSDLTSIKIKKIIDIGENKTIEFKQTLTWDIKKGSKNKTLLFEIKKAIAGFLNCEGGTLFIGVKDNNDIFGIDDEIEKFFKNKDGYLRRLTDLIKDAWGQQFNSLINPEFHILTNKTILAVNVDKSIKDKCFLDGEVYLRTPAATVKLEGRNLVKFTEEWENRK